MCTWKLQLLHCKLADYQVLCSCKFCLKYALAKTWNYCRDERTRIRLDVGYVKILKKKVGGTLLKITLLFLWQEICRWLYVRIRNIDMANVTRSSTLNLCIYKDHLYAWAETWRRIWGAVPPVPPPRSPPLLVCNMSIPVCVVVSSRTPDIDTIINCVKGTLLDSYPCLNT